MGKGNKISQSQIAKELGVSQSLVSIVLNGRREGIAEATYERVWEFALHHGYSPKGMKLPGNGSAVSGAKAVGYFLRAPLRLANKSNFFSHVTQGLHDYLRAHQTNMLFLGSELDFKPDEFHKLGWNQKELQGIVVMGQVAPAFLSSVREIGIPLVSVAARSPGLCHSVISNEFQSAEQLVEYLVGLGHRHFAYIGGMSARSRNEERLMAMKMALNRHDLELFPAGIYNHEEAERMEGYRCAEKLLESSVKPFPTAWICVNGLMARGVISKLFQVGLRVPEDISVGAFDNTRVASEELPGITSASAIPEDMGSEAGRIVLDPQLHAGNSLHDVVLPSRFFARESTGQVSGRGARRVRSSAAAS